MVHFLYLQYESHEKERVLVIVPIAKGDLKWRDALLVAHRLNSNEF